MDFKQIIDFLSIFLFKYIILLVKIDYFSFFSIFNSLKTSLNYFISKYLFIKKNKKIKNNINWQILLKYQLILS